MSTHTTEKNWLVSALHMGAVHLAIFTVIFTVINLVIAGLSDMNRSLISVIIASFGCGVLQYFCFAVPRPFGQRMAYMARTVMFGLSFFVVLAVCAWLGKWLPMQMGAWIVFCGVYLVGLVVSSLVLRSSWQRDSERYAKALEQRKS